jgi:6-phosphogluconolactonase (cycloisomerase 2 family)
MIASSMAGTYTQRGSKGILCLPFLDEYWKIETNRLGCGDGQPIVFLLVHPSQRFVYAASEDSTGFVSA